MSENMLSIRDLKIIDADAYVRGALGVTAETIMDVAADVVDMLIMREHYKISSALHIVGMSVEQYVAVRAREADRWWDRDKDEEKSEEAEAADKKYEMKKAVLQYDLKGNFIKEYESTREATRQTGAKAICEVCKGKRMTSGGFIWRYKN